MPLSEQATTPLPGATSLLDALGFLKRHGPGLERLLSAALGAVAKDLVDDLLEAVRTCDLDTARNRIDTMIDTLAEMAGDQASSADSTFGDTALLWYVGQLHDLARTWRGL